jgi:hypothetical protein
MTGKTSIEEMVRFVRQEFNPESDAGLKNILSFNPYIRVVPVWVQKMVGLFAIVL